MGLFITFEGIEGSGKSTQARLLAGWLGSSGREVILLREPGGTPLGERVRQILLNGETRALSPWAELFLYEACRAELVKEVIAPALREGKTVVCDRFTDSTLAYQGYARGLSIDEVEAANRAAAAGLAPDVTFLIDCPVETGLKRAWSRIESKGGDREDRFEKEAVAFHEAVRKGYLDIASREPERLRIVDGTGEIASIHAKICGIIKELTPLI